MKTRISFSIEDAEDLSSQLKKYHATLTDEWSKVLERWKSLEADWQDEKYEEFEPIFNKLKSVYDKAEEDYKKYIAIVEHKIKIANHITEKKQRIPSFIKKPLQVLAAATSIVSAISGVATQDSTPINSNNQHQASIKAAKEVYKPIAEYGKLQLEKEKERVKREQNTAANARAQPTASGSPPDPKAQFANNLDYKAEKTTQNDGITTIRIRAYNSNNNDTGDFLNADIQLDGRVHIRDTEVAKAHRKQGIGSKMLRTLENQLPNGTELYFVENQAEVYWEKKGFKSRQLNDGKIEYFKKISRE